MTAAPDGLHSAPPATPRPAIGRRFFFPGVARPYLDLSAADSDPLASKPAARSQSNLTEGSL